MGCSTLAASLVCLAAVSVAVFVYQVHQAADYPGALLVSDHSLYKAFPNPHLRRDTSYRTTDSFPQVYNWYSTTFDLGPEARAQSACIVLEKAETWLVIEQTTSVMLCDASAGRMMFVMRSVTFRYR